MKENGGFATLGHLYQNVLNVPGVNLKFLELQDFYSNFFIIGPLQRNEEFLRKLDYAAFEKIRDRVKFVDYDHVAQLHTKSFALIELQKSQISF